MNIIWWLIIGLIAGAVAGLLVPGRDPMGVLGTLRSGSSARCSVGSSAIFSRVARECSAQRD